MNFLSQKYRLFILKDGQYILKPVFPESPCVSQQTNDTSCYSYMEKQNSSGRDFSKKCRKTKRRPVLYVASCAICDNRFTAKNRLFKHMVVRHDFERKVNAAVFSKFRSRPLLCSPVQNVKSNFSVNYLTNQDSAPINHVSGKKEHVVDIAQRKSYRSPRKSRTPTKLPCGDVSIDWLSEYRVKSPRTENVYPKNKHSVRQLQIHCDNMNHNKISMVTHVVSKELVKNILVNDTRKLFSCTQCECKCQDELTLSNHIREEHDWRKLYSCEVCPEKFAASTKYKQHCMTHNITRPFTCDQCIYRFPNESSLKVHYRSHNNERPYKCRICGAAFSQSSTLSNHLKRHTGDTPHQCEICGKSFAIKGDLRTHHRIHRVDKPFSCDTCGKTFPRRSNYVRHLRKHTGEKPYKCEYCEKCFARSEKCVEHQRTHTNERPFVCIECEATFADSGNFSKHKKLHKQGKVLRRKKTIQLLAKTSPTTTLCAEENDISTNQPSREKNTALVNGNISVMNRSVGSKHDETITAVKPIIISLVHPPMNSKSTPVTPGSRTGPGEGVAAVAAAAVSHVAGQYITFTSDDLKTENGQFIALLNDEQSYNTNDTKLPHMFKRDDLIEPLLVNADNLVSMSSQHQHDIESNSLNNHYFMLDYLSRDSGLSFVSDGHLLVKNASVFLQPPQSELPNPENSLYGVPVLDPDSSARELRESIFSQEATAGLTSLPSYSHISLDVNQDTGLFGRVECEAKTSTLDTNTFLNDDYFLKDDSKAALS